MILVALQHDDQRFDHSCTSSFLTYLTSSGDTILFNKFAGLCSTFIITNLKVLTFGEFKIVHFFSF